MILKIYWKEVKWQTESQLGFASATNDEAMNLTEQSVLDFEVLYKLLILLHSLVLNSQNCIQIFDYIANLGKNTCSSPALP